MAYRPKPQNFNVPMWLLVPEYQNKFGTPTKIYPDISTLDKKKYLFFAEVRSYGGTETTINDQYTVIDTATVRTWYRPDILSDCRVINTLNDRVYEIMNEPENIEFRNQFLQFKIKCIGGRA
ncbi:MAG: head-tail adaptor protein [Beduini sp.]|uniref:head-tail adaptor protein n=1 Tax=Beduini sp. TaxID=1922300 RepID=UPI00399FE3AB